MKRILLALVAVVGLTCLAAPAMAHEVRHERYHPVPVRAYRWYQPVYVAPRPVYIVPPPVYVPAPPVVCTSPVAPVLVVPPTPGY